MMCEHDMDHLPFTGQKHCRHCGKSEQEIALEIKLAAANARVAELEKKSHEAFISSSNAIGFYTIAKEGLLKHEESLVQRAEQAEAKCNQMEADCADFQAIIKRLQEENAKRFNDNTAMYKRMMGAEAQNKRMREALRRCGLCKDYSHEKAKCYHDYEGYRPPQATCDHPEAGFKLVDWAALEVKP